MLLFSSSSTLTSKTLQQIPILGVQVPKLRLLVLCQPYIYRCTIPIPVLDAAGEKVQDARDDGDACKGDADTVPRGVPWRICFEKRIDGDDAWMSLVS